MDLCFNFHLDHFLQFSLLKKVWVSVQPSTELLLERARKHKRAALLLNSGWFSILILIYWV